MIDPSEFSNPDALLDHIIDSIVKPQLAETCDGDTDADWHSGVAWVFGCRQPVDPEHFLALQEKLSEGVALDYVLAEFSTLKIVTQRERQHGNVQVRYIELASDEDEPDLPSADDLASSKIHSCAALPLSSSSHNNMRPPRCLGIAAHL